MFPRTERLCRVALWLVMSSLAFGLLCLNEVEKILGNDLAGARVWADVSPPTKVGLVSNESTHSKDEFSDVFVACAVTRSMSAAKTQSSHQEGNCEVNLNLHVRESFSVSQ